MLNKYFTALLGAVASVQALPTLEESASDYNASIEVAPQKGFEVVIVYATPDNCPTKPTQCPNIFEDAAKTYGLDAPKGTGIPSLPAPSMKGGHDNDSGFKGKATGTMEHDAPVATLTPGIHWNCDTKPAENIIPIPPTKGSEMYYGITDPSKEGHYAFLTYYFKKMSVNLDHCDHVSQVEYGAGGLKVSFGSDEAFKYALDTWKAGEEMILIAYTKGCGDYAKGDRCFFKVTTLQYKKGDLVIIADGKPCHPDDVIDKGETEWGWWHPKPGGGKGPSTRTLPGVGGSGTTTVTTATSSYPTTTTKAGASFTWDPKSSSTGAPGGSDSPSSSGSDASSSAGSPSSGSGPVSSGSFSVSASASASGPGPAAPSSAPGSPSSASSFPSSVSGSPSSVPGSPSSAVSDDSQPSGTPAPSGGSSDFSNDRGSGCDAPIDDKYGLPVACPGEYFDLDLDEELGREKTSEEYAKFIDEWADIGDYADVDENGDEYEFWKKSKRSDLKKRLLGGLWNKYVVQPVKKAWSAAQEATSISGSINKDMSWKLPNAASEDPNAKTLKDPNAKQVTSPWGDSILLKAFGSQEADDEKKLNGYMNVFCVGCGVSGSARVAGKASWTPLGGFLEGQVNLNTDVQFVLKLGIDAQMTYKQEFTNTLLDVGLPGLEYGVISIGPRITVGSRVELEAEAKGKLLAGAEMGLQNAHVMIDFVNPGNSQKGGWDPYFKPVFEAEGEVMLAATLGLPIGIKCGLRIASWDKSVGIIDEPSIKGVAQVAASIGLDSGNKFGGGFKDVDGCTGISTQISWRNRLYIDILGDQKPLLDTSDRPLARGCIALPGAAQPSGSATPSASASALPSSAAQPSGTPMPSGAVGGGDEDDESTPEPVDGGDDTLPGNDDDESVPGDDDDSFPGDDDDSFPGDDDDSFPGDDDDSFPGDTDDDDDWVESEDDDDWVEGDDDWVEGEDDDEWTVNKRFARKTVKRSILSDLANKVVDITSKINTTALSNVLSYTPQPLDNLPYNLSNGFEYALMVDEDVETMVVSCANGNMYAFTIAGDDNPNCSEMWAQKDDVLLTDGASRVMHYYNNTMSAVGVSRLRLDDKAEMPESGVPVAFVPYTDDESVEDGEETEDYYYMAVDPHENIFYPIVCDFEDGSGARLFLAEDPVKGVEMLQSEDVMYTVTGGKVSGCYPMVVMQGQYEDGKDWQSLGEESEDWDWDLEDDWYEDEE